MAVYISSFRFSCPSPLYELLRFFILLATIRYILAYICTVNLILTTRDNDDCPHWLLVLGVGQLTILYISGLWYLQEFLFWLRDFNRQVSVLFY